MLGKFYEKKGIQLTLGFLIGVIFGFLLQKSGVTSYNVIIGQLLLKDFTVVKVILSAVLTGMIGIYLFRGLGLIQLHPKPGSVGSTVVGGLIFGVGFGILGYCPGTVIGASAQGSMDALFGGVVGILIGAGLFAKLYPKLEPAILKRGYFGELTIPQLLRVNAWLVVLPVSIIVLLTLILLEGWTL